MIADNSRKKLAFLLLVVTLLFFALVFAGVYASRQLPVLRIERTEAALAAGDIQRARVLADRISDEAAAAAYRNECDYLEASALYEAGEWAAASEQFAALGNYKDAAEKRKECDYALADALAAAGSWQEAMAAFQSLAGYSDAMDRYDACRYEYAGYLADNGESIAAFSLYDSMGDYRDARSRMTAIAVAETGIKDETQALNAFRKLTPEEVARREALAAQREALPQGILDVGFYHTVALRSDGTVLACGDNEYGQCEVSGWTGITAVAAGAYHTVGLRSDGTVLVCGRGTEGQGDTASWTGIVAVAASDYATFGLRRDGTVAYTGYQSDYYRHVDGWSGVSAITGGSYALGALRGDGTALITHEAARSEELRDLVGLVVNTGYAVGLRSDGTVISPCFELDGWSDIIALSCSGTGVVGLRTDGSVAFRYFRETDAPDFTLVSDAVAIACGGTHFAWVRSDGTVGVIGETDAGQGDTGLWKLF